LDLQSGRPDRTEESGREAHSLPVLQNRKGYYMSKKGTLLHHEKWMNANPDLHFRCRAKEPKWIDHKPKIERKNSF